ncbi:AAA family ATPase [Cellulosimicrobium cellulans]|uniref:AAA family ATPase n=1 Tax=Cellulosimicrobium cellulans TaxID=1710 RepID=UPI00240659CC|nr:ATP-binding protein [Cellulosimicrobium cellulans]MDF9878494.1 AAA15 family ATPase/GTPase [Cellulosimicrobium cellulans]
MILLRFSVRNHKSIRDEITVDLTRPSLRTLQPKDGDWGAVAYPIVGVFGPNATGKSALLDALRYTFAAIRLSATAWQASKSMQRAPFALDGSARASSSMYELDFVHEGRRHLYGFEVGHDGIKREWLRDVPGSRWRTLLDRDQDKGMMTFHPSLRGRIEVTERELVLSRALLLRDSPLHPLSQALVSGFDCVLVKDSHREARLTDIADSLAEGTISFADLEALLQVADIGVVKVSIEETNIPENIRRALRRFTRELREKDDSDDATPEDESDDDDRGDLDDDQLAQVVRHLVFTHRGTAKECPTFSIQEESDGTIAWLAIAVPALEALRSGGLLLVDEIDASLHPHLLEVLLGAFADPLVNIRQAQLIFTSHESYVLSPLSEVNLEPQQVWLTDKTYEGITELTSLADFPKHPDANVARRYLTGRYGGTPRLSPSTLAALVGAGRRLGS